MGIEEEIAEISHRQIQRDINKSLSEANRSLYHVSLDDSVSTHQSAVLCCRADADKAVHDAFASLSSNSKRVVRTATAAYIRFRFHTKGATHEMACGLAHEAVLQIRGHAHEAVLQMGDVTQEDIDAAGPLLNTWYEVLCGSISFKDMISDSGEERRFQEQRIVDANAKKMEVLVNLRKRMGPVDLDLLELHEQAELAEESLKRFKRTIFPPDSHRVPREENDMDDEESDSDERDNEEDDSEEERPAAAKDLYAKHRDKVMSTLQDPGMVQGCTESLLLGQKEVKNRLHSIAMQYKQPELYKGIKKPGTLFFEGASGSGKGLAVRILANETGCPLFKPKERFFAKNLELLVAFFDIVKEYAEAERRDCIVFLDEADEILSAPNTAKVPVIKSMLQNGNLEGIIPVIATNHGDKITNDVGMKSRTATRLTFCALSRAAKRTLIEKEFAPVHPMLAMREEDWDAFFDAVDEDAINGHTIQDLCGNAQSDARTKEVDAAAAAAAAGGNENAMEEDSEDPGEEDSEDAAAAGGNENAMEEDNECAAAGGRERAADLGFVGLEELKAAFGAKAGDGTPKPTKADVIAKLQERFVLDSRTVKDGAIFLFEDVVQKVLENRHLKALGATEQQLALLRGDKGRDKLSKMDGVRNALQECVKEAFGLTVFAFAHKNDWIAHAALVQYENGETTELYVEVHPPKKMNRWCSTKLWYKDATKPDDHKAAKLDTAKRTILQRVLGRALDDSLWDNLSSHLEEYYSIETIQKLAAKARENANGAAITFEHFGLKTDELSSEQLTEFSGALWQRYCIGPLVQRNYRDADNCPAFEYPDGYYRIADFDLYNGYYAPITTLDDFYQRMPVSVLKALSPTGLVLLPTKRNSFVAMKRLNSALRSIFTNQRNRLPELQGSVIWHLKERDAPLPNPTPYPFTGTSPQDLSALWILPHQSNYDKNALIAARSYQDIEIAGFY